MQPFIKHTGLVAPLDRVNVDTDQMVPKQFLKWLTREGFGRVLFYDWRYLDGEKPNPDFVLNHPRYKGASILLARANFGCGSSREQAAAALKFAGVGAVIAVSFARIFFRNSINLGLPALVSATAVERLEAGDELLIDLTAGTIQKVGDEAVIAAAPLDPRAAELLAGGGLIPYLKKKYAAG